MTQPAGVLVIDDNKTSWPIFTKALNQLGCEWAEVASGSEALHRLENSSFDLVLLDIGASCEQVEALAKRKML